MVCILYEICTWDYVYTVWQALFLGLQRKFLGDNSARSWSACRRTLRVERCLAERCRVEIHLFD